MVRAKSKGYSDTVTRARRSATINWTLIGRTISEHLQLVDQELIPYHLVLVLLVVGETIYKKAKGFVVSNRIGMKFGRIVPQENTH